MGTEESRYTIGDYVTLVRGTTYKGVLVGQPGPALLGLGSIEPGGGFREGHYKTYGGDCPAKLMLLPGDLYVALKGATKDGSMVGSVARVPKTIPSGRLTQDTVKLEFQNQSPHEVSYIYWLLRTPQYRAYCANRVTGSAVAALSREDFLAYPVPPLTDTRRQLVDLFDFIEDKIRVNQQMNHTLESIARALFKSWFIDFDPVRAKLDGQQPAGMDAETAALFPAEFEDSAIGQIPRGWNPGVVDDLINILSGGTPKTSVLEYWGGNIPWFSVKDTPTGSDVYVLETEKYITEAGVNNSSAQILPEGTTIVSARGTVGRLALVGVPMAMNQSCYGIQGKKGYTDLFIYYFLRSAIASLQQQTHGTVFETITRQTFTTVKSINPPSAIAQAFDEEVQPLLHRIRSSLLEIRSLTSIRDALLPKLLSGEIRVKDAEKVVEQELSAVTG